MKVLNVIETAYRATLEEQDDPVIWISHAMKGAGAELDVLLRANAVNYAVKAQAVEPLAFGDRQQGHSPQLADDISALIDKDVAVYVVEQDLSNRGVQAEELIAGLKPLPFDQLPALFKRYDQVWHW
ncbi:MAG: DsrE family protein [Kiloniellales bacterium]|nr:DsrE family protein [Kiloniellales bacterium]